VDAGAARGSVNDERAVAGVEGVRERECRWLFLDTSKNHTRRWCDMKVCGNRIKARRFKALHAAG